MECPHAPGASLDHTRSLSRSTPKLVPFRASLEWNFKPRHRQPAAGRIGLTSVVPEHQHKSREGHSIPLCRKVGRPQIERSPPRTEGWTRSKLESRMSPILGFEPSRNC